MRSIFIYDASDLYNKDIIAFGTGDVGKRIIPLLVRDKKIRLHGVTNSRIKTDYAGTFQNTNLPLRSIDTWARLMPKLTILITVTKLDYAEEIWNICSAVGFCNILFISPDLVGRMISEDINYKLMQGLNINDEYLDGVALTNTPMLRVVCFANELCDTHKASFSEFKYCNIGRNVVVTATGPSLNYYTQISNAPHIGVNACAIKEDLQLDYYFLTHYIHEWCEAIKLKNSINFFAKPAFNDAKDTNVFFPEDFIRSVKGRRFFRGDSNWSIYMDIEHYPLMGFGTIIFSALQFALFTMPKRIFLVGCDCANNGYFCKNNGIYNKRIDIITSHDYELSVPIFLEGYQRLKDFAQRYYPSIEIISVNPVGLTGMFHDVYTESYLDAHSEIDRSKIEVLDLRKYEEMREC